ncbi:MAG TPA: FAD-dependent oxidoreductase, partial [Burkholderiales bacterium]
MDRGVATQGATRVAIVGAGYAGMAAAASLAAKKVPVTVFEAGPLPGGRARRVNSQGIALDNGQHILVGAYTELFRMMDVVGVAPAALLRVALDVRYAEGFHFRRAALPRPFDLAAGLLTARGIALSERVSAACFMRALQRTGFQLDADIPVSELLRRHRQTGRLAHFLWQPLCISALNTPPELASARVFLAVLRDTLAGASRASDLVLPRVDLSQLFPEPAAAFIAAHGGEIRLQSPVRELAALRQSFNRIIVAVGPHQL